MDKFNFPKDKLMKLIIPLMIEQFLVILVGMVDTIMVSGIGEYAVSAVSLVDAINLFIKQILSATAAGGAIVAAQYLGANQKHRACQAAKQLTHVTLIIGIVLSAICVVFNAKIIGGIFGSIDKDVFNSSVTYFYYTGLAFPFLAIYNSSAALFRAMGDSKVSMMSAAIMNLLNIAGNAVLIYGFKMGVQGAAISTLFSTIVGSAVMLYLITRQDNKLYIIKFKKIQFDKDMIKKIFGFGIPTGIENSLFQAGRLILSSLVSTFGTAAIAANAVANAIAGFMNLPAGAVGLAMPAVVGQSMGAGDIKAVEKNIKKLIKMAIKLCMFLDIALMLLMKYILKLYNLGPEAYQYAYVIIMVYGVLVFWLHPFAFTLAHGLRSTGDIKMTMAISITTMVTIRLALAYILAFYFNLGFYSIWIAMFCDWGVRAILFYTRFRMGKWKKNKVI